VEIPLSLTITKEQAAKARRKARQRVLNSMTLRQAERHLQDWYGAMYRKDNKIERKLDERPSWHHVYQLIDSGTGESFYIGTGSPRRLGQHLREAKLGVLTAKCSRIRAIWRAGNEVEYRIIGLFKQRQKAFIFELSQIKEFGDSITNRLPSIGWEAAP
jgi:hypothetical protein